MNASPASPTSLLAAPAGRSRVARVAHALALLALAATPALAHQYWLAPTAYAPAPHKPVEIAAFAGTGFRGEAKPWSPGRCVRFVALTSRSLDLSRAAAPGDTVWSRFAPADDGGALLAFESNFTPIELAADPFDAYLADEGLAGPLAARKRSATHVPGRERYRRCAKAWLAGRELGRATTPVGMPLEIVPLELPGANPALHVRVLWNGKPLASALVKTWRAPLAAGGATTSAGVRDSLAMAWQARTDARGELAVPCVAPGEWLVSTVTMEPSHAPAEADWESTWASLTFARPAGAGAKR